MQRKSTQRYQDVDFYVPLESNRPYNPHQRAQEGFGQLTGDVLNFMRKRKARKDYEEFINARPPLRSQVDQRRQQQTYQQPLEFQHSVPQQYQQTQPYPQHMKYNFKDLVTIIGATMACTLMLVVGIIFLTM